jgi:AcrR family transcriptional regulator
MAPPDRIPRGTLSRGEIVEAALRLAEHEPIEALTIRLIAAELGASAMALYTHFANKDELLDAMRAAIADQMFRRVRKATWPELLETIARAALVTVRAHPNWLPLLLRPALPAESAIEAVNRLIALMQADGLKAETALQAYMAAAGCGLGFALMERMTADATRRFAMLGPSLSRQPKYAGVVTTSRIVGESGFDEPLRLTIAALVAELQRRSAKRTRRAGVKTAGRKARRG